MLNYAYCILEFSHIQKRECVHTSRQGNNVIHALCPQSCVIRMQVSMQILEGHSPSVCLLSHSIVQKAVHSIQQASVSILSDHRPCQILPILPPHTPLKTDCVVPKAGKTAQLKFKNTNPLSEMIPFNTPQGELERIALTDQIAQDFRTCIYSDYSRL